MLIKANPLQFMNRFEFTFSDTVWHKIFEPLLRHSKIFRTIIVYYSYFRRQYIVKPVPSSILSNKEGFTDYHISPYWFTEKKQLWISGIARLKNSADFLTPVVEAFLPYLDQIILVAEQADDGTNALCETLAKQYPDKVKYYLYEHEVRFRSYDGADQPTTESIHSFAYFTNWAFSKSTYKYVMRLDDDILPVPETWEKMREYILSKEPNEYLLYYGINIYRKWNQIWIMKSLPRGWTWGDNGIYPVSQYSYFTQIVGSTEAFHLNLIYKPFELGYLHLKNLKKWFWTANYAKSEGGEYYKNLSSSSDIDEFHKYVNFPSSRIYKILLDNKIIWTH